MMQGQQYNHSIAEHGSDSVLIYGDHKQLAKQMKTIAAKRPRGKSNFFLAFIFGFIAAAFGAVIWASLAIITDYSLGYLSLAVALLVGLAMRSFGNGSIKFCILGALLVFLACFFSDIITTCDSIARTEGVRLWYVIKTIDGDFIVHVLKLMLKHSQTIKVLYIVSVFLGFASAMKLRPH